MQHAERPEPSPAPANGTRLPRASDAVAAAMKQLIADLGEPGAMEIMKFSRQTISRLAAGMSVQPATLVVAAQRLGVDLVGMIG